MSPVGHGMARSIVLESLRRAKTVRNCNKVVDTRRVYAPGRLLTANESNNGALGVNGIERAEC